ncbi:hypothetical protein ASZ78_016565 [Callipepla squamata]|uniref:PHD-type domain-containing protein n=1 Tax=Callipepla squamata TaxID=9009 RepID=A0A226MF47_CALSU|nr:hypothetical protein ASZ78_016565 [Callipepla squamata]
MPKRKRDASSLQETACMLCRQECAEPNSGGRIPGICWMLAHEFCLIFANILFAETPSGSEALDITHDDLTRKLKKANRKPYSIGAMAQSSAAEDQQPYQSTGDKMREKQQLHVFLQRHHRCDAIKGFHSEGRDQAEEEENASNWALTRAVGPAVEALSFTLMGLFCSFQQCFVCGKRGVASTCAESGCDRSFHLSCAVGGECITQFFGELR